VTPKKQLVACIKRDAALKFTSVLKQTPRRMEGEYICKESYLGDWFELGVRHNLLEQNCLALRRDFDREPKGFQNKGRSLKESVDDCVYHAEQFTKNNSNGGRWTFQYERERSNWCALASQFLKNRISLELLKGEDWEKENVIDGLRKWPPADLPVDWFDFEESFDVLFGSRDALYQQCVSNGIEYPDPKDRWEEWNVDFDDDIGASLDDHAKKLKLENRAEEGKEYWRKQVVQHLKDLLHYREQLAFLYDALC
jgi:hypothetical protein